MKVTEGRRYYYQLVFKFVKTICTFIIVNAVIVNCEYYFHCNFVKSVDQSHHFFPD